MITMNSTFKKWAPYFLMAVVGAVLGGGLVLGVGMKFFNRQLPPSMMSTPNLVQPPAQHGPISDARDTAIVRAAQAVAPAVVGITNKAYARDFFNHRVLVKQGTGSGVIFDSNGYIVTNNHVVAGAQQIMVSLSDGRVLPGKVLGADPATDLAVVKVDATGLPVATFGDSSTLMVGEPAIAIGNPLGLEFKGSVTAGVISALNRSLEIGERKFKLIQTDAAINPGNSGGALVSADGKVIGINSAKILSSGVEGIGFAIPINTVRPIIKELIAKGKIVRPYLGVGAMDKKMAENYGYILNIDKGVYVARVDKQGPAFKAGIQEGDVILKVAGTETNNVPDLLAALDAHAVGDKVDVLISRQGKQMTISVVLAAMPDK
jgi:serine protease Do